MKKTSYLWNFVLIAVITIVALWFALKDNYQEVVHAIGKLNGFSLTIILVWGILYTCVWGLVYVVLGRKFKKNYSVLNGIVVAFTGTFFSGITPSATGGQFGQAYIFKKQGIAYSDGASILWADFIIYQTTMMVYVTILFCMKFFYYSHQSAWFTLVLAGYVVNFVVIFGLYTMALFPKIYIHLSQWIVKVLSRLRILKNPEKTLESWTLQMTSFTSEIKKLAGDKKAIVECMLINTVRLTMLYALPFLIARLLGIHLAMDQLVDVIALSSFVTMANSFIPIPGASGGTEMMFSILFSPIMGSLTSAVLILWRVSTYHIILVVGGVIFMVAKAYYDRRDAIEGKECEKPCE
ncbi:lysylphosphatidylglycerol synthase transmembrane domain-containing protein [uncultured Dubosiella sp.]|uniref:lysylphosphatidylglycerol synthase transmembrane domain-containing protein n=3 Tax=uncultured Dubosiella sp. TaxID=1937011 RepID=UPI0025873A1C|nr:lysylphosphatidylglycerol synthase transmembrane domain-containing protein [uncultured Dubosiella sp.]